MKKDTYTIKDAFTEAVNKDAESIPLTDPFPHSVRFLKRMTNLFKKDSSPVIALSGAFARKVAVAVVCLFTVSALSFGAGAAIIHFGGFNTDIHDKGTDLSISAEQQATLKDSIEEYYTLGAIPEGFELTYTSDIFTVKRILQWEDDTCNWIEFQQTAGKTQSWNLNTEDYPYEEILFNGNEAIYYEWKANKALMWIEDGYVFKITTSNMTREETFILAESLRKE